MRNILLQNLFTSLPDTEVVVYFYLELQNSEFSKTSWVGSQILYIISIKNSAFFSMYSWSYGQNTKPTESVKSCWHSWLHYVISRVVDLRLRQIQLGYFSNFMHHISRKIRGFWLPVLWDISVFLQLSESVLIWKSGLFIISVFLSLL
jgi:hypothetical protein